MSHFWDLEVYKDGETVLSIEIKNKMNTSEDWAKKFHRNLLAHSGLFESRFFMIACPDRFYIWSHESKNSHLLRDPDHVELATPLLSPYVESVGFHLDELSSQSFELVVSAWLSDFVNTDTTMDFTWAETSGFRKSVRGGEILLGVRA